MTLSALSFVCKFTSTHLVPGNRLEHCLLERAHSRARGRRDLVSETASGSKSSSRFEELQQTVSVHCYGHSFIVVRKGVYRKSPLHRKLHGSNESIKRRF